MDLCQTAPGTNYKRTFTPQKTITKTIIKKPESAKTPKKEPEKTSLKIDYCDSYHHRQSSGSLSGNERYNMLVERLEMEFEEKIDLILMTKTSESSNRGKFDIYLDGKLHHDSVEHGIPGPSAIENLIEILRKRLSK
ncbi:Oidioi.mRNA.OKI2018_I69.PAR.g11142.t1.cds [Oikopleura dioica]|uniref:Oidioi.mRNA.OKI2018_I69.PAR.g11142.t1.cds n=1 Tax=Oikopleura dioica TaxID=34765 RepID=A0ABN7RU81_OIKDI|nr:Oidioi.mRNA.OKI2018_I69.PAR.g11142.t1.cds [Oikopleura dioica]